MDAQEKRKLMLLAMLQVLDLAIYYAAYAGIFKSENVLFFILLAIGIAFNAVIMKYIYQLTIEDKKKAKIAHTVITAAVVIMFAGSAIYSYNQRNKAKEALTNQFIKEIDTGEVFVALSGHDKNTTAEWPKYYRDTNGLQYYYYQNVDEEGNLFTYEFYIHDNVIAVEYKYKDEDVKYHTILTDELKRQFDVISNTVEFSNVVEAIKDCDITDVSYSLGKYVDLDFTITLQDVEGNSVEVKCTTSIPTDLKNFEKKINIVDVKGVYDGEIEFTSDFGSLSIIRGTEWIEEADMSVIFSQYTAPMQFSKEAVE